MLWVLWVLWVLLGLVVAPAYAANTHGSTSQLEQNFWWGDAMSPYVVEGCLPTAPVSGVATNPFLCKAYVRGADGELYYVTQSAASVTLANTNGTHWLAVCRDTSSPVTDWTRQTGTHYVYRQTATRPADPVGCQTLAQATVTGSVITAVAPVRTTMADITHYGACQGCSAAQNTTAIQTVLMAYEAVYIPPGQFHVNAVLTSTGKALTILGAGRKVSQLIWDTDPGGLSFTTDSILKPLTLQGLSLVTGAASGGTCVTALLTPNVASSSSSLASIHDTECIPLTGGTHYWDKGLELTNIWGAKIHNYTYLGLPPTGSVFTMTRGIHLLGNSIDVQMSQLHIYHAAIGIDVGGTVEGPVITDMLMVSVEVGILFNTVAAEPGCAIQNGHINAFAAGIRLRNRTECVITNMLIYKFGGSTSDFTGIHLDAGGFGNNWTRIIGNRIAIAGGTSGTKSGITLTSSTYSIIADNSCSDTDNCLVLGGSGAEQNTLVNNRSTGSTNMLLVNSAALNNYMHGNYPPDSVCVFANGDPTPSVADCPTMTFITGNTSPTTITAFDNVAPGLMFTVRGADSNTTIANSANIKTLTGQNFLLRTAVEPVQFRCDNTTVCYELGVSAAKTLLYTATGAIGAPAREVAGSVTLAAGTLTLTLTGAAVYTSNASYICTANSSSGTNPVQVVRNSGSSVTFNGTGTDQVMFRCVGN